MRNFDNAPRGTIDFSEFEAAQDAATANDTESGTITFGPRVWTHVGTWQVSSPNLTLRGEGSGRTTLQARSRDSSSRDSVISVLANRVRIRNMTIRGATQPRFPTGFVSFGFGVRGNVLPVASDGNSNILATPNRGVVNGIGVSSGVNRLLVHDCVFRRVSTGIRFRAMNALDGFDCEDNDFYTLNTMIFAAERRPSAGTPDTRTRNPARRFRIVRANLLIDSDRPVVSGARTRLHPGRGIELDFGNASFEQSTVFAPVNLRGSVIRECNIPRVSAWSIGLNRVSNITLRDNVLGGGGGGRPVPTSFVHVVHMEDQCRNVTMTGNRFTQSRTNSNGDVLGGSAIVWLGGDNGFPRLDNNSGNTFGGDSRVPLVRLGRQVPSGANVGDFGSQRR